MKDLFEKKKRRVIYTNPPLASRAIAVESVYRNLNMLKSQTLPSKTKTTVWVMRHPFAFLQNE